MIAVSEAALDPFLNTAPLYILPLDRNPRILSVLELHHLQVDAAGDVLKEKIYFTNKFMKDEAIMFEQGIGPDQ